MAEGQSTKTEAERHMMRGDGEGPRSSREDDQEEKQWIGPEDQQRS